jgi:hypothetical protein
LFVPGFVVRAEADTTTPPAPTAPGLPGAGDVAPAQSGPGEQAVALAAPAQVSPVAPPPGQALATLPWGDGNGEVGLVRPTEGLTRGPEALAVAPDGRIAILDSVNTRLVLLASDGSFTGTVPLRLSEPRFLAVDNDAMYVLDADRDHTLVCLDWRGTETRSAVIPALEDVVTGLFATDGGPCVEVAHDQVFLVKFKDTGKLQAAGRIAQAVLQGLAGRPVDRDLGKAVKITFKPKQGAKLRRFAVDKKSFKAAEAQAASPALPGEAKIDQLVSLDGDGHGGLVIGARVLREQGAPQDLSSLIVYRVSVSDQPAAAAVVSGVLTLSDSPFAYLGQPYVVAPDGRVFQPVGTDAGYSIRVYSLPVTGGTQEVQP